jgi:hypothetical protein
LASSSVFKISRCLVWTFLEATDMRPRALECCAANLDEFEAEQAFLQRGRWDGADESVHRGGGCGSCMFVHMVRLPTG